MARGPPTTQIRYPECNGHANANAQYVPLPPRVFFACCYKLTWLTVIYTYFWTHTFASPFSTLPQTSIPTLLAPFKNAMQNWKHIWNEIKSSMLLEDWNALGFQRTAEIYYDAVKAVIQIFERREGKFPYIPSDCEKGSHLKLLLSY